MLQNADIEVSVHPSLRLDVYGEPIMADSTQLATLQQHYNISHTGRRVTEKSVRAVNTGSMISFGVSDDFVSESFLPRQKGHLLCVNYLSLPLRNVEVSYIAVYT
jgi:hypothetical protein